MVGIRPQPHPYSYPHPKPKPHQLHQLQPGIGILRSHDHLRTLTALYPHTDRVVGLMVEPCINSIDLILQIGLLCLFLNEIYIGEPASWIHRKFDCSWKDAVILGDVDLANVKSMAWRDLKWVPMLPSRTRGYTHSVACKLAGQWQIMICCDERGHWPVLTINIRGFLQCRMAQIVKTLTMAFRTSSIPLGALWKHKLQVAPWEK